MLAHITAWHDLTTDRLNRFIVTGKPQELAEDTDAINARVARQAVGRTGGEVLKEMEISLGRLRRHIVQLTDSQLMVDDRWAANVIAGNTWEHYAEHMADLALPEPAVPGQGAS
jgi:UDP-N-acetylmuramyl pentapeptide synthase